jgi:predicted deacylase
MADRAKADYRERFPLLGRLTAGSRQVHQVTLPGTALANDPRTVVSITGTQPGPVVFINAGVHGGEYPAIETVIRMSQMLDPANVTGAVVLMPVLNVPAFWARSMFVCPVDNQNPNRLFPGDPNGSYSEQMVYALTTEFVANADCYMDLHGGDIVEELVPFSICRRGEEDVDRQSLELARVFGLPYVLKVDRPIQVAKGSMSFVAGAERGVPSFIAEAGGVGRLQLDAVEQLTNGTMRVLRHLGVIDQDVPDGTPSTELNEFEWLYSEKSGMFYPSVEINEQVSEGQVVGRIGSLTGETLEVVQTPIGGRVLFTTTSPAVSEKGLLMGIGV